MTATRLTRSRTAASTISNGGAAPAPTPSTTDYVAPTAKREVDAEVDAKPATPRKKRKVAEKPAAPPASAAAKPRLSSAPPEPFHFPSAVAHLTAVDQRFATMFERIPCRPFLDAIDDDNGAGAVVITDSRRIDPFRTLVTSIIGQQVSWMAARSITRRFVEHFCKDTDPDLQLRNGEGPFPSRHQVSKAEVTALKGVGLSTRKAEYVIELAQRFVDGRLTDELLLKGSDEEVAESLIAVRGIGRWTVDMFLIFTLRRPDILPVGDLGVQKGLLRWVLAAYGALPPPPPPKSPKTPKKVKPVHTPSDYGSGLSATPQGASGSTTLGRSASQATELDTDYSQSTQLDTPTNSQTPATPATPSRAPLLTPTKLPSTPSMQLPSTPAPPPLTPSSSTNPTLPGHAPDSLLHPPAGWDDECACRAAPLPEGLTVATLKSRLAGKKAKGGAYLLPAEMEALTHGWRPYRSLGTYYSWSMAGETGG